MISQGLLRLLSLKLSTSDGKRPWGLKWRSSIWFVTLVVGYGITTDLLIYSIIIPVIPFQLEHLQYHSVSALTSWLLFSYSVGLVLSTPPISYFTERYNSRRYPLLLGLLALMAFMVLFMEAPSYPVMVVARFVQGISSSCVWVVGLALLCDTVPEQKAGQQLGLAMIGLTLGLLIAPPIGGTLYEKFGFRGPFIFGIIVAGLDFIGRLLVIEKKDALVWDYDPARGELTALELQVFGEEGIRTHEATVTQDQESPQASEKAEKADIPTLSTGTGEPESPASQPSGIRRLSSMEVLTFLIKSTRTLAALFSIFIYGVSFTAFEPTLPLRLQDVFGFDSSKVGIIFFAIAIPPLFSSPFSGWICDHYGVEWILVFSLTASIPWFILLIIKSSLEFFIVCLALGSLFLSAVVSPLTAELASVTRCQEGVGFGHIYGAFNLAYGAGSCVGPLMAGQIYDHFHKGWIIVCAYAGWALFLSLLVTIRFTGERPLALRAKERISHWHWHLLRR